MRSAEKRPCWSGIVVVVVGHLSLLLIVLLLLLFASVVGQESASNGPWATWWEYDGEAGPSRWGLINPEWSTCRTGKFQSPIDIHPQDLLYDPNLRRMNVHVPPVLSGTLVNTGNDLTLRVSANLSLVANFSDGPLLYTYRLHRLQLHLGRTDRQGSEHSIEGYSFAAELQLVCYNSDLYKNLTEAMQHPYGVAIIAILVEASDEDNIGFRALVDHAKLVPWQGQTREVKALPARSLMPQTHYYVTYEGSFTQPACLETVTWVLFNRPLHVHRAQLDTLRQFQKRLYGEESVAKLAGNHRWRESLCSMKKTTFFQVNPSLTMRPH